MKRRDIYYWLLLYIKVFCCLLKCLYILHRLNGLGLDWNMCICPFVKAYLYSELNIFRDLYGVETERMYLPFV